MEQRLQPKSDLPPLSGILQRVCGKPQHLNSAFALIDKHRQTEEITEFYSPKMAAHLIMFDEDGNIAHDHQMLAERTGHTFMGIRAEGKTVLTVPEGARSVRTLLPLMSRDTTTYSRVFRYVGNTLGVLERANIGLPDRSDMLDAIALSPGQDTNPDGIYLVPPYNLSRDVTPDDVKESMQRELGEAGVFTEAQLYSFSEQIEAGWHEIG
jgi:hypothetical protein